MQKARAYAYLLLLISNVLLLTVWYVCDSVFKLPTPTTAAIAAIAAILLPFPLVYMVSSLFLPPLKAVWQAVLYITPDTPFSEAPDVRKLHYGRELVANLVTYIYKLGQTTAAVATTAENNGAIESNFVANSLPLPLMIINKEEAIVFANKTLLDYIQKPAADVIGQSLYTLFDFSFMNDDTLDSWLVNAKEHAVTSQQSWEHVRLTLPGDTPTTRLLDIAAYYNKNNPNDYETMLVLFDHNDFYGRDDQAINFVALAVHELRTPLTMLRGYIEALEEDLDGQLNPELDGYMKKMKASAQQLTNFVNNVLNVARIEGDQMMLKLQEDDWGTVLQQTLEDLSLRASVRGITIKAFIQPGLPTVGVDRVSIAEVMSNLIDNAIKYSGQSKEIIVTTSRTKDGMVETTVQDFGVGVPTTAMPHLFEKFYRDHHNRQHVGGTGIGLYLCKKLIGAHGGNIWVRSKEGEGSTFAFTLIPYAQLAEELKNKDTNGIVRGAHGWIKNHSLYRR